MRLALKSTNIVLVIEGSLRIRCEVKTLTLLSTSTSSVAIFDYNARSTRFACDRFWTLRLS